MLWIPHVHDEDKNPLRVNLVTESRIEDSPEPVMSNIIVRIYPSVSMNIKNQLNQTPPYEAVVREVSKRFDKRRESQEK